MECSLVHCLHVLEDILVYIHVHATTAGVIDGRLIVAGGQVADGNNILSSAEQYDPSTGQWTALASMSTARYQAAAGDAGR
jgi:hypothetical protein